LLKLAQLPTHSKTTNEWGTRRFLRDKGRLVSESLLKNSSRDSGVVG